MFDDHVLSVVSLVVGLVSLAASVAFFALGARTERRDRDILEKINAAIQNWQGQIMASSIDLLNSRVEIVGAKSHLEDAKAKQQFIQDLSERVKYLVEHPASGEEAKMQSYNLQMLLQCFESATKSNLTPEMLAATIGASPSQST